MNSKTYKVISIVSALLIIASVFFPFIGFKAFATYAGHALIKFFDGYLIIGASLVALLLIYLEQYAYTFQLGFFGIFGFFFETSRIYTLIDVPNPALVKSFMDYQAGFYGMLIGVACLTIFSFLAKNSKEDEACAQLKKEKEAEHAASK